MSAAGFTPPDWLVVGVAIIMGVFGIAAAAGTAYAIVRQAGIKASLDAIIQANSELRQANADLHKELIEERVARAEVEGKLNIFVDSFAERIVAAVVEVMRRLHPEVKT